MSVQETQSVVVTTGGTVTDPLGQFFSVSGSSNPTYLVVNALDRNEYTAAANGDTGSFSGNGATLGLSNIGGDGRGAGIVFTWQASSASYVNTTYGSFSQLNFTSSDSANDVTNLSVFTTSNLSLANACASNAYALMQEDAPGYVGSVTFANDGQFSGSVPTQATPNGVAAAAQHFIGDAWNENGCWVMASTIAAEAGASLPVNSTAVGVPGHANGEWVVLYNGPVAAKASWQSLVSTGCIVSFTPGGGGGHITTCVSGSGATAMLVDNIAYQNSHGGFLYPANDGSSSDLLIQPPHLASQEWQGVSAGSVVIYALDTPVITDKLASATLSTGGTVSFSSLFTASDPGGRAITKYQVYNTAAGDSLLLSGKAQSGATADNPLVATSLTSLSLLAGSSAATDTLEIRGFNGTYYGDWQALTVNVTVPPPKPPVLVTRTANQSWKQGQAVSLKIPTTTFKDPQGQMLTYSAAGAAGAALPSWLQFDPGSGNFSGTVPASPASFTVAVTATDTAGLSATETFAVNVAALAPVVAARTPTQTAATGSQVNFSLPSGTFVDPQGQSLICKATLSGGAALPGWLKFDPGSLSFSGTAPGTAQTLQLAVTATDTSKLSAVDVFTLSIAKTAAHFVLLSDWQTVAPTGGMNVADAVQSVVAHPFGVHGMAADWLVVGHH